MTNSIYKIGSRLKMSGTWYEVRKMSHDHLELTLLGWISTAHVDKLCEEVEHPTTDPYPWFHPTEEIPEEPSCINSSVDVEDIKEINEYLTTTYGDPQQYIYDGKTAANEYGLNPEDTVLLAVSSGPSGEKHWAICRFWSLVKGVVWRKLPPVLEGPIKV